MQANSMAKLWKGIVVVDWPVIGGETGVYLTIPGEMDEVFPQVILFTCGCEGGENRRGREGRERARFTPWLDDALSGGLGGRGGVNQAF